MQAKKNIFESGWWWKKWRKRRRKKTMKMREIMQPKRIRPYLQKLQKTKVEEGKDETRICHYRQYSDAIAKKSPKFRDAFSIKLWGDK